MTKITSVKASNRKASVMALALLGATAAFAATGNGTGGTGDSAFQSLFGTFSAWLQGNLGKLLALLGFAGTFVVYMMTHKGSVLFVGIIMSLIAGGLIGISETFFDAGKTAFTPSAI